MKKQNLVIACVSLSLFISFFLSHALSVAVPFISRTYDTLPSFTTYVVSAYPIALACFLLPASILARHFAAERVFVTGLITCAIVTILMPFSPNFITLVIGRILQGAFAAMFLSTSMTLISNHVALERRYMAVGVSVALTYIGISTSLAIGGLITEVVSFHAMLDIAGILLLVVAYFSHFIPNENVYQKTFSQIPFAKIALFVSSVGLFLISLSALSYTSLSKYGIAISFVLFVSLIIRDYQDGVKENREYLKEKARLNRHKKLAQYGRFSKQIALEEAHKKANANFILDVNTNSVMSDEDAELMKHVAAIKALRNQNKSNDHQCHSEVSVNNIASNKNAVTKHAETADHTRELSLNDYIANGLAIARQYTVESAMIEPCFTKAELKQIRKDEANSNALQAYDDIPTLVAINNSSMLSAEPLYDELAWNALDEGCRCSELNDVCGVVPVLMRTRNETMVTTTSLAHYNENLAQERLNNVIESVLLSSQYGETKLDTTKSHSLSFATPNSDFADMVTDHNQHLGINVDHEGCDNIDEESLYLTEGLYKTPSLVEGAHHRLFVNSLNDTPVELSANGSNGSIGAIGSQATSSYQAKSGLVLESEQGLLKSHNLSAQSALLLTIKRQFASIFNHINSGFSSYTVPTYDHLKDDEIFDSDSEVEAYFSKHGLTAFSDLVKHDDELLVSAFSGNTETARDALSEIKHENGFDTVSTVAHLEAKVDFVSRTKMQYEHDLAETIKSNEAYIKKHDLSDVASMNMPQPVIVNGEVVDYSLSFNNEEKVEQDLGDVGTYDHDMFAFTPSFVEGVKDHNIYLEQAWQHENNQDAQTSQSLQSDIAISEVRESTALVQEALHNAFDSILDDGTTPTLCETKGECALVDCNTTFDVELDCNTYDPLMPVLTATKQGFALSYSNELAVEPLQEKINQSRNNEVKSDAVRHAAYESLSFDENFDEVPDLVTSMSSVPYNAVNSLASTVGVVENQDRTYLYEELDNEFDGSYNAGYGCPPLMANAHGLGHHESSLAMNEALEATHQNSIQNLGLNSKQKLSFKEYDDKHVQEQSDAELMSNIRKLDISLRKKKENVSSVLIPIHLLMKNRTLSLCVMICFCCYVAIMAEPTLLAMYAQFALGLSAMQSGLIVFAQPLSVAITSFIVAKFIKNVNSHIIITAGLLLLSLTLASFTLIDTNSSVMSLFMRQVLVGIGFALFSSPTTALVTLSVEHQELTQAFSIQQLGRMMGQGISFALMMIALNILVEVEPSHLSYAMQFTAATHEILGAAAIFGFISVALAAINLMVTLKLRRKATIEQSHAAADATTPKSESAFAHA